jgi:hypothetical protein
MRSANARLFKAIPTAIALALLLAGHAGFSADGRAADKELRPSGTIMIDQTQVAFLVSGASGGGELKFKGRVYPFKIGGLGIGGIGVSEIHATGTVYNLDRIEDFEGAYGEARTGFALGDQGLGKFWLQKGDVLIKLQSSREGIALSLGADAVKITLK